MKNIILCEGSTDFALIQYYMRKAHAWKDENPNGITCGKKVKYQRTLSKGRDTLSVGGCGGCSQIIPVFDSILEINTLSDINEAIDKIVIITDRDEIGTETDFISEIEKVLVERNFKLETNIQNNVWTSVEYSNGRNRKVNAQILLLVIPFEDTGAMETFLLKAIAQRDSYDAAIINKCTNFVDTVDVEKRYLSKRRYITKSKFDVYFSIRTAVDQFQQRQDILKYIEWEKYELIQNGFKLLKDLSN